MMSDNTSKLDKALGGLPREIEPSQDLWPSIRANLDLSRDVDRRKPTFSTMTRLAAGFVLLIASCATTYLITRHSMQPTASANFAAASDNNDVVKEYLRSRAELDRLFAERIASLPSKTRANLESNLADLRRAENEIVASLSQNPSDALLHELLMSTYQSEAQLLADVNEIPVAASRSKT
jgi:hypothetical protein